MTWYIGGGIALWGTALGLSDTMGDPCQASMPVYQQVANVLRTQITRLESDRPVRLPGEYELARLHRVARGTVRQALQVLVDEGLIKKARRRGSLTVPEGIRAWRRLHASRVIQLVSDWFNLAEMPSTFYGQIYQGVLAASETAGYCVAINRMVSRYPRIGPQYEPAESDRITGLILIGAFDERYVAMHAEAGYPVVCTDYWPVTPLADAVLFDCYGEGQRAAEFLISQGHRELFYLGNMLIDEDTRERHESDADLMATGFRRAVEEANLVVRPRRIHFVARDEQDLEAATRWFLSLRPRPTGGVIFDKGTMVRLIRKLKAYGVRCPEDISLICKAPVGQTEGMTAMCNDPVQMGRMAVELLLDRAAGRRPSGVRMVLASTLHRGRTVRCLRD